MGTHTQYQAQIKKTLKKLHIFKKTLMYKRILFRFMITSVKFVDCIVCSLYKSKAVTVPLKRRYVMNINFQSS